MVGGATLQGGNANNRLLRFIAFGAIMPVILIRYMLGFASRVTYYYNTD